MEEKKKESLLEKIWGYTKAIMGVVLFSTGIVACMAVSGVIIIPGITLVIWIVGCFFTWFLPVLIFFKNPVGALIAGITNALIPLFSHIYFNLIFGDRTSVMQIELAIPVLLAYALGYGAYTGYKKIFVQEKEAESETQS